MTKPPADPPQPAGLEAVLAGVLRRSRLSIVVLAEDAAVVWANDAALQTLPALDPARTGANLLDVIDVAVAGTDWTRVTDALATRKSLAALELPVRNGRWLRVDLQAFSKDVVPDPRLAAALVLQDVTLRRRARERERVEGELMRQAGQLGRVGAWEYDVDAGKVNWSDETFEIHGL
jgi:PAS domain-containing protein